MNVPRQICPFPAVEYIPLYPEPFLEFSNQNGQSGLSVFATLTQFRTETPCRTEPDAECQTQSQSKWQWPQDRIILACYGFRPLFVYYRGHDAVILAKSAPETAVAAALDSGFFYKELINFEAFLENGAKIAGTSWQVSEYVAIRRPPHSKGARSSIPGIESRG